MGENGHCSFSMLTEKCPQHIKYLDNYPFFHNSVFAWVDVGMWVGVDVGVHVCVVGKVKRDEKEFILSVIH